MTGKTATPKLVEAARGGDRAAFERLVVELQDMAVAVCYGRLGNRELARSSPRLPDRLRTSYVNQVVRESQANRSSLC